MCMCILLQAQFSHSVYGIHTTTDTCYIIAIYCMCARKPVLPSTTGQYCGLEMRVWNRSWKRRHCNGWGENPHDPNLPTTPNRGPFIFFSESYNSVLIQCVIYDKLS